MPNFSQVMKKEYFVVQLLIVTFLSLNTLWMALDERDDAESGTNNTLKQLQFCTFFSGMEKNNNKFETIVTTKTTTTTVYYFILGMAEKVG